MENNLEFVKVGHIGDSSIYRILPAVQIGGSSFKNSVSEEYGTDSATVFDEDVLSDSTTKPLFIKDKEYKYIPYGDDDDMPAKLRRLIGASMVTSQGMAFDIIACYGQGIRLHSNGGVSTV